ncbi:hypothetical protein EVAR_175_1 [Eumeta japonica]|uniref:Uncharacterized protein n=1 Tax=Eumeta variegata TaxID=151549 RepID=A0A4C1SBT4_EUMVA|nr:hypothetical protein EVAR_175_1 [Eumeta japonica]
MIDTAPRDHQRDCDNGRFVLGPTVLERAGAIPASDSRPREVIYSKTVTFYNFTIKRAVPVPANAMTDSQTALMIAL